MAIDAADGATRNRWLDAYIGAVALLAIGLAALVWDRQVSAVAPGQLT